MTTNETSFFRDKVPFDQFRDVMLPALSAARRDDSRLRIWCSAASSGQEPYSLAMIIEATAYLAGWTIDLLASDINAEMIERAKEGLYSQFEVLRGLPIQMLARHFHHEGGEWRLSSSIRSRVQFEVFNLLDSFEPLGQFDVIFCRNVLIYFDQQTKHDVLGRLADALAPDGYLVLGAAETVRWVGQGTAAPGQRARHLCEVRRSATARGRGISERKRAPIGALSACDGNSAQATAFSSGSRST